MDEEPLGFCDPRRASFSQESLPREFYVRGYLDDRKIDNICDALRNSRIVPIEIRWAELASTVGGMAMRGHLDVAVDEDGFLHLIPTTRSDWDGYYFRIIVNSRFGAGVRFVNLVHELGHLFCGHLGDHPHSSLWSDRSGLSRNSSELEAACVSWLVARSYGLDPGAILEMKEYWVLSCLEDGMRNRVATEIIYGAANLVRSLAEGKPPPSWNIAETHFVEQAAIRPDWFDQV